MAAMLLFGPGGPDRNAPEASVGFPLVYRGSKLVSSERDEGIFPAPSTEKSAPYDSKRAGLAPGPRNHLAPVDKPFFKERKCYESAICAENRGSVPAPPENKIRFRFFPVFFSPESVPGFPRISGVPQPKAPIRRRFLQGRPGFWGAAA